MAVRKQTKKKRRMRQRRLMLVIVCAALIIGVISLSIWGVLKWHHNQEQAQMRETIALQLDSITQQREAIEEMKAPENTDTGETMDAAAFEAMKTSALAALDPSALQTLSEQKEISVTDLEAALDAQGSEQNQQALYLMQHIDEYPIYWLEFYMKDNDRYEFVKAYPQRYLYQDDPGDLSESLESVPRLLQWDLRWGYQPYGDSNVAIAGCAPTCLSMVLSYIKQDPSLTPVKIKNWADLGGYYVNGAGTAHSLLSDAGSEFNVNVEGVEVSQEAVSQALSEGKVLIFNMVPGTFTSVGHFIVVCGEQDGKLVVNDPNSIVRSEQTWDYADVLGETNAIWAYSAA